MKRPPKIAREAPGGPDEGERTPPTRKRARRSTLFQVDPAETGAQEAGGAGTGGVAELLRRRVGDGPEGTRDTADAPPFRGPTGIPRPEVYRAPRVTTELAAKIEALRAVIERVERQAPEPSVSTPPAERGPFRIAYGSELNESQHAAVTAGGGPVLVIAGAGTGKTRTITYRVAYLVESGVDPRSIMLLTFTRKAAAQMLQRADVLLKQEVSAGIDGGTFHATANYLLRRHSALLGISPTFSILDTVDSEDVIDLIRRELKPEKRSRVFPTRHRVQELISRARNTRRSLADVVRDQYTGLAEYLPDLVEIGSRYARYKVDNNLLDFDDLVELFLELLRSNVEFAQRLHARYRHILVDEYQDTNLPQKEMVDALAAGERNVMVVGDDTQSIYSFRGANYENILRFPETYPDCRIIRLEQNYRSKEDILGFTNDIIRSFVLGFRKRLYSRNVAPGKPVAGRFFSPEDEAKWIVDKVLALREKDVPLSDMAVLYRSTFHSNYVQAELLRRQIPYVVYGGIRFSERRHVKDIIAFLRLVVNPIDAVAWNRILRLMPGVGPVMSARIIAAIRERDEMDLSGLGTRKTGPLLAELQTVLSSVSDETLTPLEAIGLLKAYYLEIMKETYDDWDRRALDIDVLETLAARYRSLERFISDFALDPPSTKFQDQTAPRVNENEEGSLVLSTIHSAKGLEWSVVFVPHLLDGLFPSDRSVGDLEELEEERRLFYVACTRAKNALYLTMPASFASWGVWLTLPSRFLAEVDRRLYRYVPDLEGLEEDEEEWT